MTGLLTVPTIDLSQAISWLISLLAITITIFNLATKGAKDDTTAITTMLVKLETIEKTLNKMDGNINNTQDKVEKLERRIIILEMENENRKE